MASEIERVLDLWRRGERLLEALPEDAPERNVVQFEVVQLQALYKRLTSTADATDRRVQASAATLDRAARLFEDAQRRVNGEPPDGSAS